MITKEEVFEGEYSQFDVIQLLERIVELEKDNTKLGMKSTVLDSTKGHLTQCEAALVEREKRITELEKDIAFLQSCVNSGETTTKADRPSERAKMEQGE